MNGALRRYFIFIGKKDLIQLKRHFFNCLRFAFSSANTFVLKSTELIARSNADIKSSPSCSSFFMPTSLFVRRLFWACSSRLLRSFLMRFILFVFIMEWLLFKL